MNKQVDKYIKQYTLKAQENIVPALSQGTFSKNITNVFPLQMCHSHLLYKGF